MIVLFIGWCVADVKDWAIQTFASEAIAQKFEDEEIDGRILISLTVRSDEAMEKLGLTTLGKKGKFLKVTDELAGTCAMTHLYILHLVNSSDFLIV